jgi:hypothetical protein
LRSAALVWSALLIACTPGNGERPIGGIYTGRGYERVWRLELGNDSRYILNVGKDDERGVYDRRRDSVFIGYGDKSMLFLVRADTLVWVDLDSMRLVRQRS